MLEHEIKKKVLTIGNRKGQTVYYAYPKSQQKLTNEMVIERIVRETSLSEGDVSNALISLSNIVCDALKMGMSVDLAELGSLRLIVPLQDDGHAGGSHRGRCPQNPENRLHPQAEDARCRQCSRTEHRPQQREGFHGWRCYYQPGRGCNGRPVGVRQELVAAAPHTRPAAASTEVLME